MAGKRLKPIEAATAGIFATLIFLLDNLRTASPRRQN
jgi:hypothetical protein